MPEAQTAPGEWEESPRWRVRAPMARRPPPRRGRQEAPAARERESSAPGGGRSPASSDRQQPRSPEPARATRRRLQPPRHASRVRADGRVRSCGGGGSARCPRGPMPGLRHRSPAPLRPRGPHRSRASRGCRAAVGRLHAHPHRAPWNISSPTEQGRDRGYRVPPPFSAVIVLEREDARDSVDSRADESALPSHLRTS